MAKLKGSASSSALQGAGELLEERERARGTEQILAAGFYGTTPAGTDAGREPTSTSDDAALTHEDAEPPTLARGKRAGEPRAKPTHYKVVCISLYTEDIERLEGLVASLKGRGHTKANKSAVIRYALEAVDISKMPKSY